VSTPTRHVSHTANVNLRVTNGALRISCRILYGLRMSANVTALQSDTLAGLRGAYIRDLIKNYGLTGNTVADRSGISRSTLASRLRGATAFLADEIEAIATPLRVSALDLYAAYLSVTFDNPDGDRSLFIPEQRNKDYQDDVLGELIRVDFSRERFGVSA